MNDIIRMAREAGFEWDGKYLTFEGVICDEEVELLVDLVRADEREACARVVMSMRGKCWAYDHDVIAEAIRARGQA
jgi:hypothetical protein